MNYHGEFTQAHKNMVESMRRDIHDQAILKAMMSVPRHLFVPRPYKDMSYEDRALPIGQGQTISQPSLVAYMAQAARLTEDARVLDLGTGCGYQVAVLSHLCKEVFGIEIKSDLGKQAKKVLQELGYTNIHIRLGDGNEGWPEKAPFDAIIIAAACVQTPPPALFDQLALNGTLIAPIGKDHSFQYLTRYTKTKQGIEQETLMPVKFVPLIHKSDQ